MTVTGPAAVEPVGRHTLGKSDWLAAAACRGVDVDVFFPPRGTPTNISKAICRRCGVQIECLEDALESERGWPGPDGIRGGLSAMERQSLLRARKHAARAS